MTDGPSQVEPLFDTVAIVGVGLIGGSLGMAFRERGLARRVVGIARREETVREALAVGAADEVTLNLAAGVANADLVVLCAPVLSCVAVAEAMAPALRPGTLVTDVGSTKQQLLARLGEVLPSTVRLVGGHPMAGSEQGGVAAARGDLFERAIYVLTETETSLAVDQERLTRLVCGLGAVPVQLDPETHDAAVARISHLPHVVAAALAASMEGAAVPVDLLRVLIAGGFRDTTRIAASPPELWRDICVTNRAAIVDALQHFETALSAFRTALEQDDADALVAAFTAGKTQRDLLVPPGASTR